MRFREETERKIAERSAVRAEIAKITAAREATVAEKERWRGRAERLLGVVQQYDQELDRLRTDNQRMAEQLMELAMRPPTVIHAPSVDVQAILESFRKTISPDVIINGTPDGPDQQRAGIVWADQGLDNTGGTPETLRDPFDDGKTMIPDYVLDIENLDPNEVKGTKGGWYNPKQTS